MRRLCLCLALVLLTVAPSFAATDITFLQATSSTADTNSYTFAGQNLGTASADRCIVVEVASRRAAATVTTVSTLTVAGSSASILKQLSVEEAGAASVFAIAAVPLAAGTSVDVVVTFSASMTRARIAVSTLTGAADCTTVSDSDESEATDPSVALDIPANGSAVAICGLSDATATSTWTGLTERHDAVVESLFSVSGASDDFVSQQTGLTITCNPNVTTSGEGGVFVSWAPVAAGGSKPARVMGQSGVF